MEGLLNSFSNSISLINSYFPENMSMSASTILEKENEFRCPKCFLCPLINIKEELNSIIIDSKCRNNHEYKNEMIEFRQLFCESDIYSVNCKNYNENHKNLAEYICLTCTNNFLCFECAKKHSEEGKNHLILKIKYYDSYCHEHLKQFERFCLLCKCNFCKLCENKHKGHKSDLLNNFKLNEQSFKIIEETISELKREYIEFNEKVKDVIVSFLRKIEIILFKFRELKDQFENIIPILNGIKNSYLKNTNYEKIKNARNLTEKNFQHIIANLLLKKNILLEEIDSQLFGKNKGIETKLPKFEESQNKENDNIIQAVYQQNFAHINILNIKEKLKKKISRERVNQIGLCIDGKSIFVTKWGEIIIYDKNMEELKRYEIGEEIYYVRVIDNEKFITCSKKIEFWNFMNKNNEYQIIKKDETDSRYTSIFKVIYVRDNYIISCNDDKNIDIWEKKENKWNLTHSLQHDQYSLVSIIAVPRTYELISAGIFYMKFWDITNKKEICKLNDVCCFNHNSLRINDDYCICGGILYIYIISLKTKKVVRKIKENRVNCLCTIKNNAKVILSGNEEGKFAVYNIENSDCILYNNKIHDKGVICIRQNYQEDIITSGEDGFIRIWTF